jgi:hypothetical protein
VPLTRDPLVVVFAAILKRHQVIATTQTLLNVLEKFLIKGTAPTIIRAKDRFGVVFRNCYED